MEREILIQVTEEDIAAARVALAAFAQRSTACPIAQALRRKGTDVDMAVASAHIDGYRYLVDEVGQAFRRDFDWGYPVAPVCFKATLVE